MAYEDRPLGTDRKRLSQGHIRENFQQIDNFTAEDHVTFGGGANLGKHLKTVFPENGRVALGDAPVTLAGEAAIYCRQSTLLDPAGNQVAALFFRPEGQGAGVGTEYDFTTITCNNGALAGATSGCFTLPNGIKMAFGTGSMAALVDTDLIAFYHATYFTAANTIYTIQITQTGIPEAAHNAQDNVISATAIRRDGFTAARNVNYHGSAVNFSYLAIGT
jgi:hypothetical protein